MPNQKRIYEEVYRLNALFKQKSRVRVPRIFLKISEKKTKFEKKNPIIFMHEKYVKKYFVLSPLLVSNFLLFSVLF